MVLLSAVVSKKTICALAQSGVNECPRTHSNRALRLPYTHCKTLSTSTITTMAPEMDTPHNPSPLYTSVYPSHLPPKPIPGQHILALHFPPSSYTPEPTWIALSSSSDEESSITFQYVDASAIFLPDLHPEVLLYGPEPGPEPRYREHD